MQISCLLIHICNVKRSFGNFLRIIRLFTKYKIICSCDDIEQYKHVGFLGAIISHVRGNAGMACSTV